MEKVNPYTLYLSGVLTESQYLDILEKEEINEISSDLLNRAHHAASGRFDSRGDRLAKRFGDAIDPKIKQEFESNPNRIISGDLEIAMKSIELINNESINVEFKIKCDARLIPTVDRASGAIESGELRIGYFNGRSTRDVKLSFSYPTIPSVDRPEFDRMNAMKLSKFISSNGGNVKPTELPMT